MKVTDTAIPVIVSEIQASVRFQATNSSTSSWFPLPYAKLSLRDQGIYLIKSNGDYIE